MRGKKGSGHFEMIVGFVFFAGFVFFLFLFLNPWNDGALPASALESFYDTFNDNVSVVLSSVFISAENSGEDCYLIDLPEELFTRQDITGEESFVTRLGGVNIDSKMDSGDLEVKAEDEFFRVAISPIFPEGNPGTCTPLSNFELGGVVEVDVFSYPALLAMRERYYSDYSGLKRNLKLVSVFDFAITSNGLPEIAMEPANGIPDTVEVLSKDYVVKVLKTDGSVSNERINIRIW